jgi:hypothetical protein
VYGKIFAQIYEGTLASRGPWQALVTFQQLIVLADRHGEVDMTPEAISARTTIPLEIIKIGLAALEQEDPESRTPAENGRRIILLNPHRSWGWRIVNYDHYRKMRSEDERREYMRNFMAEKRARNNRDKSSDVSNVSSALAPVSNVSPRSKQYAVSSKEKNKDAADAALVSNAPQLVDWIPLGAWASYMKLRKEKRAKVTPEAVDLLIRKLAAWRDEGQDVREILERSVMNGWTGIFPVPKENASGQPANNPKSFDALRREANKESERRVLERLSANSHDPGRSLPARSIGGRTIHVDGDGDKLGPDRSAA